MNKKRKILTIVALAVFGTVMILHYSTGIHYEGPYKLLHLMTPHGKEFAIRQGNKVIWEDSSPDPDYSDPEFRKVLLEHPGRGWYLSPGIKDVRMPLFALAVFYTGLFFILAEQKPRS